MFEQQPWMFELNRVTVFPDLALVIKKIPEIPATKDMASPKLEAKPLIILTSKSALFQTRNQIRLESCNLHQAPFLLMPTFRVLTYQ